MQGNSSNTLKIIPLGGLGEIGKNTMVIAYGNDMMLVDAGLAFPSDDMLGVDLVLPDLHFLTENQDKIRGLAITHGHEDHIGGIPHLLKHATIPAIYGPSLALGILEGKLEEHGLHTSTKLHKVHPRQRIQLGCFNVEFIRCTHSIADSFSLIIRTPVGTIVHTGDFKFDFTPVDGEQYDIASLTAAQEEDGILLLMSDSTNTEREGYTPSEKTVWRKLDEVFSNAQGRIIVTTFASNVHRMKQVLEASLKYDHKVAILGRSMVNLASIALELGYLKYPQNLIVPVDEVNHLPRDRVVILTTGSQGEPLSALSRIANNEHKQIQVVKGDTVIISATPIPGNERSISNTINALCMRGADVIYGRDAGVHVSGHACREEQKLMINICKPRFFMPVHGEYRMLVKHAELSVECGVEPQNVFVMDNGDVLELTKDKGKLLPPVRAGIVLIDASRAWEIDEEIVTERRHLAEDGIITVALTLDDQKNVLAGPDVSMRGLILPSNISAEEFLDVISNEVLLSIKDKEALANVSGGTLHSYLTDCLTNYFKEKVRSSPLIQVVLHQIKGAAGKTAAKSKAKVEG